MSAPLPDALRAWFQRLIEEGLSGRAAALRLKLSPATGARWGLAIRRTGKAIAAPQGRPDRVVFIDETSVKTNLTRQRGWSQRGKRLVMDAPFGSWGTQTLIAGLSADALIAPWVIKGAMDGEAFVAYVEQVLVPSSSWTTLLRTRMPLRPKPCAKPDAGSCSCRRTAQT